MKKIFSLVFFFVIASLSTFAQPKRPMISPYATATQRIGLTDVTVAYNRPGVKGREIWGKLVPYNQVWRAGANEATMISFSDDIAINGQQVKAGSYALFVLPSEKKWTVILNSAAKQWGAYNYDSTKNVLTLSAAPEIVPMEEWLSYSFSELTMYSAKLSLRWEKISLSFTINVDTDAKLAADNTEWTKNASLQLHGTARTYFEQKVQWEKAMTAVEKSIAIDENYDNLKTKAELLAQGGKKDDAVKAGEYALAFAKKNAPKRNVTDLEKMIEGWKKK